MNINSGQTSPASKVNLASQISPTLVSALSTFIHSRLGVEPEITAYQSMWECSWMNRAGEISLFLQEAGAGDALLLKLIYIERVDQEQSLRPEDIQLLSRQLQEQTGMPVRV